MIRVGFGYDVHKLVPDRPLILGGVTISHHRGLLGHSDADVLAHSVMDALLGALALGDIGRHFPDTDPAYRGSDSIALLEKVAAMVRIRGWRVNNLDATVCAQAPRLAPHIDRMRRNIACAIGMAPELVSVKATTTEGLGFAGRAEGISSYAIASLVNLSSEDA